MKKFMAALVAVFLSFGLANAAPQAQDNLSGSKTTSYSYIEDSSNASVTLVSAVTGQYVSIYKYVLSTSGADNFYLKCGSTQKTAKIYLGDNSGLDTTYYPLYIRCGSGEALTLTKGTASTPIGISLWFTQQP